MKKSLFAILTISIFLSSSFAIALPARAQSGAVIAFDYYHIQVGNQTVYRAYGLPGPSYEVVDRNRLYTNLTKAGYTLDFLNQTTPITSSQLSGVSVLFLGKADDPPINYSASEVQAITSWFQLGGKLLMVSGNSGYTTNDTENTAFFSTIPNWVLKSIGSSLRLEVGGEVTDVAGPGPGSASPPAGVGASGSGFRAFASAANNGINTQAWAATLTQGTQYVRFHGPINVIGYQNGAYVPFSSLTADTVTWLYRTSTQGSLQQYGAAKPYVTSYATPGQYVLAAAEKIPEGSTYSKVVVAGAGFYGNYVINANGEYSYNVVFQGQQFVLNAVAWGLTSESVPSSTNWTLIIAAVVVVIVIIAAAAIYLMRRKPMPKMAPAAPPAPST
jgi:hypothetical protein